MLTVLLGGARSGKSSLAERLAANRGADVVYIATCPRIDGDQELADRIRRHRAERPAHWLTIEEETDLAGAIERAAPGATVIVDCLTTWVGTRLHQGDDDDRVLHASTQAIAAAARADVIVVTNEVGLGIVPADELSRRYRDLLGRVNQQWVATADRALLLVAGKALDLRPVEELL